MYHILVQRAASNIKFPSSIKLKKWAQEVLEKKVTAAELTLRIVNKDEMTTLNSTYRHKNKPTNVLSFPFEMPADVEIDTPILGDIVICAEVIKEEANQQNKSIDAHWAHMIVHGILHLLGYDHENDADAEVMEKEEIAILKGLGFDNPYNILENGKYHE